MNAFFVKGTYSFTTNEFNGQFATPSIDRFSSHPGPGWEILTKPPSTLKDRIVVIMYGAHFAKSIRDSLWDTPARLSGEQARSDAPD